MLHNFNWQSVSHEPAWKWVPKTFVQFSKMDQIEFDKNWANSNLIDYHTVNFNFNFFNLIKKKRLYLCYQKCNLNLRMAKFVLFRNIFKKVIILLQTVFICFNPWLTYNFITVVVSFLLNLNDKEIFYNSWAWDGGPENSGYVISA